MRTHDWQRLCAEVLRYGDTHFPGCLAAEVRYRLPGTDKSVIIPVPIPAFAGRQPHADADADPTDSGDRQEPQAGLTERQREIMQVFRESAAGERIPWDEVARRVGEDNPNSRFRDDLAALVRLGLLGNTRREGYFLR